MSERNSLVLDLPSFKLHKRSIHYFKLPCQFIAFDDCPFNFKDNCVPLFLGADVSKSCGSYAVKNLGRLHCKYATEGLASKVCFPTAFKISGVRGAGDKIWFYSIQGLFKIAFEFYSREEQKSLLENLQSIWLSRINDSFLPQEIFIPEQEAFCIMKNPYGLELLDRQVDRSMSQECSTIRKKASVPKLQNDIILENLPFSSKLGEKIGNSSVNRSSVNKRQQKDTEKNEDVMCMDSDFEGELASESKGNDTDNSKIFFMDSVESNSSFTDSKILCHCKKLEKLVFEVFSRYKDDSSCEIVSSYLEAFIVLCIQEKENIIEKQSTAFPIKLIKDYLEMKSQKLSLYQDDELAIHIISSWVGEKFQIFRTIIKQNINAFKQNYIDSIQQLPQPEDIIKEIYPSAMYSLLYLWIRGPENEEMMSNDPENLFETKRAVSVCLLALELLNNMPVTGVGHYVHTLLQVKNIEQPVDKV